MCNILQLITDAVKIYLSLTMFTKRCEALFVTTQPPFGVFFNFTSFICLPFVNTEYIKQG